jgi:hypothetical protein
MEESYLRTQMQSRFGVFFDVEEDSLHCGLRLVFSEIIVEVLNMVK